MMADPRRTAEDKQAQAEAEVLAAIAEMAEPDRSMAEAIHRIVAENAPILKARMWYSMPAYAKDGKVICFFQSGLKFKTRYSTLGFQDNARLDDGPMWPVAFAIERLTPDVEATISELIVRAAG